MRQARPVLMWAPIIRGERSEWIHSECIRSTRRAARKAYLALWLPEHHKEALGRIRFAKVVVSLQGDSRG